jgi:hypothetical protein
VNSASAIVLPEVGLGHENKPALEEQQPIWLQPENIIRYDFSSGVFLCAQFL